jgi:hypothetical protein
MNRYKILCLTLISLLFFSCGESKIKIDNTSIYSDSLTKHVESYHQKTDTAASVYSSTFAEISFNIDLQSYVRMVRANTKNIADIDKFVLQSFTRLKSGQDQFKYYYESFPFNISASYKTFLILEDYESESAVWLVNYTSDMKLIDALEVYYDNAEGCWQTTSVINKVTKTARTTIKQIVYDCYADPEETTKDITITAEGKFKK